MEVVGPKPAENNMKTYACNFEGCTSVFGRPCRLAQHRLIHDNVKHFVCKEPNCEKAYKSKSHLDRHINTVHKETEPNVLYCCPKCMKKYVNRQNLKRHIKISHIDNNKPFCCALCKVCFKKKHQLRAHMYIHNGLKSFRCALCDRDFVTLYEKKKHMKNHKTYQCEHCDQKYTRWTDLVSHKRNVHVSLEYICHDCGRVFKERGHIIRHVKKHLPNTPEAIFICPYENCTRHYSRNGNLKQHILVKHERLTFDCPLCGAKLSTKKKLNDHIEKHNRPDVEKVHKTLATGRQKRKDAGTIRCETALKLAGIVKQKNKEGKSRLSDSNINGKEDVTKHRKETDKSEGNNTDKFFSPIAAIEFREKDTLKLNSNISTNSKTLGIQGDDDISSPSNQTKNIQNQNESNKSTGFLENIKAKSDPFNGSIVPQKSVALNRADTQIELSKRVDKSINSQIKRNNKILENFQSSLLSQHSRDDKSTNNILPSIPNALTEFLKNINTGHSHDTVENIIIEIEPLDTSSDGDNKVATDHSHEHIELQIKIENDSHNSTFNSNKQQIKDNGTNYNKNDSSNKINVKHSNNRNIVTTNQDENSI